MMMVAHIMSPCIFIMRLIGGTCFILVDDVLIIAKGQLMLTILARSINFAPKCLQTMGAKIAMDKSYNLARTPAAE